MIKIKLNTLVNQTKVMTNFCFFSVSWFRYREELSGKIYSDGEIPAQFVFHFENISSTRVCAEVACSFLVPKSSHV